MQELVRELDANLDHQADIINKMKVLTGDSDPIPSSADEPPASSPQEEPEAWRRWGLRIEDQLRVLELHKALHSGRLEELEKAARTHREDHVAVVRTEAERQQTGFCPYCQRVVVGTGSPRAVSSPTPNCPTCGASLSANQETEPTREPTI